LVSFGMGFQVIVCCVQAIIVIITRASFYLFPLCMDNDVRRVKFLVERHSYM
jgi:hypothetical protein